MAVLLLAELLAAGRTVEPGPARLGRPRPGAAPRRRPGGVRLARGSIQGRRPRG